jgi:hypothetical protein
VRFGRTSPVLAEELRVEPIELGQTKEALPFEQGRGDLLRRSFPRLNAHRRGRDFMEASGVRRNLITFTSLALVAGALVLPVTALGAPPVLSTVGHTDRHPTATWQLPPGVESRVAEVATSPEIASDGYFFF